MSKKKERPVVVTTAHRGVFFGYATDTSGNTIQLRRGRMCVYWSADMKSVMELAVAAQWEKRPASLKREILMEVK